jgi:hypothetical protein
MPVNSIFQRSHQLKQMLIDFVMDAEDELAVALERFSAEHSSRANQPGMQHQRYLIVSRFLVEGVVDGTSPIKLFLQQEPGLSDHDRFLIQPWEQSFFGLFEVVERLPDRFDLMNWTTAKRYTAQLDKQELPQAERLQPGDIFLAQIAPIPDGLWMFFSPWVALGKLGKPKLAVAIGNFKQNYKPYLYSDAPELLAEAWKSVEHYHQSFIDFFGGDEVTLPGYQLGKKMAAFQDYLSQQQLEKSGMDGSRSLADLANQAGASKEELAEAAEALGADSKMLDQLLEQKPSAQMAAAPAMELPAHLKQAEFVTAVSHPQWGQLFLPSYHAFKALLESEAEPETLATKDQQLSADAERLVRQFLADIETNAFVWHRLASQYPTQLEQLLQKFLQRPEFDLQQDLDALLQEHGKPLEPELPEIASVPLHLHDLFQEAVLEVSKEKSKAKGKSQKPAAGFKRG